ncbi:MAG: hypothetical protein V1845_01810 [bacterium]
MEEERRIKDEIILILSFGYRCEGDMMIPGKSNDALAGAAERELSKPENQGLEFIAQWEVGLSYGLRHSPIFQIRKHRVDGQYLDSEEVIAQAVEWIEKNRPEVKTIRLLCYPFLHRQKCARLIKAHGFGVEIVKTGWVPCDRKSKQWYTKNPVLLLLYAVLQGMFGYKGKPEVKEDAGTPLKAEAHCGGISKPSAENSQSRKPKHNRRNIFLGPITIAAIIGLVLIIVMVIFVLSRTSPQHNHDLQSVKESAQIATLQRELKKARGENKAIKAELEKAKSDLAACAKREAETKEQAKMAKQLELATGRNGNGVINCFKRQILAEPVLWGFEGDIKNKKALRVWADKKAYDLAVAGGYLDPKTRREIRICAPDKVAYLLVAGDIGTEIQELEKDEQGVFHLQDTKILDEINGSWEAQPFEGDNPEMLQSYEYPFHP